jgi:tetratricopeptide (TPR) repeat protein
MKALFAVCVAAALSFAGAARADDQPWANGVTDAQKAEAQKNLDAGNAAFLQRNYKDALEKYRAAIKAWDHPAIRFNIVRCLIQLEQPVEAAENLEAALKYGAAPLEEAVYSEALNYQKLFAKQIGDIDVSCSQEGTKVTLDGETLIEHCPGKGTKRVKPGTHQVVGVKQGFLTQTLEAKVVGGEHEAVDVKLVPLERAAKITRKWASWKPWVVFGGGLAVAAAGAGLYFIASSNMNEYDNEVTRQCATTGCDPMDPNAPKTSLKDNAIVENRVAITFLTLGIAGAIAGGVGLYLNRTHTVYPNAVEKLDVQPAPGGATVSFHGSF